MAAHRVFCTLETLSEVIRLRKDRPYSTVYSIIDKLGDVYLDCENNTELLRLSSSNPIVNKLLKRPNRKIYCRQPWNQAIKTPRADDIFLLLPPSSKSYSDYRERKGVLLTSSLTDMQVIDDLGTSHYRPYTLLTEEQKEKLGKHGEEYEDISSWRDVFSTINVSPINSAVIIDNYLLSKFDRRKPSLYNLIQSLVPKGLTIPFHLSIFIYNKNGEVKKDRMEQVISEIHGLKLASKIQVSIVVHTSGDVTHDRSILTNYHIITSGRGFSVIDNRGVKENARGEIVSTFNNICNIPSITSMKHIHSHILDWLRDIYIDKRGMNSLYAFKVGDDFDNRLLSD